jgi:hypothetical protein
VERDGRRDPADLPIDPDQVARAQERVRRLFRYEAVDRIPAAIDVGPECGVTIRDALHDADAWLCSATARLDRSLRLLGDDYIPWVGPPWAAFFTVPAMLGAELWWEKDPNAWPAVRPPLVTDLAQLDELAVPDPHADGFAPEILRRLALAAAMFPPEVSICGVDMTSPLGDVLNIMDQTLFFVALKRAPEAIHRACRLILEAQIALQEAALATVGSSARFAALSIWQIWRPEDAKVLVSDDIAGLLGPSAYEEFDLPYASRLIERFGGGVFHNCGPHQCARHYQGGVVPIQGLNCSFRYSRESLPTLREEFGRNAQERLGRRGHLEVMFERHLPLADMVAGFRELKDALAPDVAAVPYCQIPCDGIADDEILDFCAAMRGVGEEYAAAMRWQS